MSISLYRASVPVYVKLLTALSAILDKAAAHAAAAKFEPEALLTARLFPDMWPLTRQVQAAASLSTRGTARLAGVTIPALAEAPASFADLKGVIAAAVKFFESVDAAAVDAGADKDITFPIGDEQRTMKGGDYFASFTLPNFYFHLTSAYAILRHNGVPLGKQDFLGGI